MKTSKSKNKCILVHGLLNCVTAISLKDLPMYTVVDSQYLFMECLVLCALGLKCCDSMHDKGMHNTMDGRKKD